MASSDADAEVRRAAIGALGFASDDIILPSLLLGLNDPVWQVREEAATTIGKLRLQAALDKLIAALHDSYWQVRLRAARALGRLRDATAVSALTEVLQHPISNLRKEAALALGEIGAVEALPALESVQEVQIPKCANRCDWQSARFVLRMAEVAFTFHAVSIVNHVDSGLLDIEWSDGTQQRSAHAFLRKHCKCADCISADRPEFSAALRLREIRPVGSYGLQLIFNDAHDRGIYPWSYLHGLGTRTEA